MYCRVKSKMKTLKIIVVVTLVALAASLLIASAYAYTGGRMGTSTTPNTSTGTAYGGYAGGMMGNGGMMRGYGSGGTAPQQSGLSSTSGSNMFTSMYNWMTGFCRGMMSRVR